MSERPHFTVSRAALDADGSLNAAIAQLIEAEFWSTEWALGWALLNVSPALTTMIFRLAADRQALTERRQRQRWAWQAEERIAMSLRRPQSFITGIVIT